MTRLNIPPELKSRREHLRKMVYLWKRQLIRAYASTNPVRIRKAKISLARVLYELAESPELGPPPKFEWGLELEMVYKFGFDPNISWKACEYTQGRMYRVARLLEASTCLRETA